MEERAPNPADPLSPDASGGFWERHLRQHGFLHLDRSLYNLRAVVAAVPGLNGERLLELCAACPDGDLALNGLERMVSRLDADRLPWLADPALLQRAVLLAGTSDVLVESAAESFSELRRPQFTDPAGILAAPFRGTTPAELEEWHRLELLRICLSELEERIDVEETARFLSVLADGTVEGALALASSGENPPVSVVALGKWGGLELNYSSDIDFFLVRPEESDPPAAERTARRLLKILAGEGMKHHLYRTDLRLRPGGPQAALVPTAEQARHEFHMNAGAWERMVHIRVRVAAGDPEPVRALLEEINDFVYEHPFQLDAIREMKGYKELLERSVTEHERELKVGWGGIRDVEYVVQFLQLLHGGIYRRIRGGNVFRALRGLGEVGALTTTECAFLLDGYRFLRRVEHRLMLRGRLQRFLLPEAKDERRALSRGLGFESWQRFRLEFDRRRDGIREILDRLFHRVFTSEGEASVGEVNLILAFRPSPEEIERVFAPLSFKDPIKAYSLLRRLAYPRRPGLQSPRARQFFAHLFPQLLGRLEQTPDADQAVLLFVNCVETLGAPAVFYQLLAENPENCALFVDLFGRSRFLSDLLLDYPGILDELVDRLRTGQKIQEERLVEELRSSLAGAGDRAVETRVLHEFRALHTLEIAVLDLGAKVPLMGVLRRLSDLARSTIRIVDEISLRETEERLGSLQARRPDGAPRHMILALGRLGGGEMGYASDIDMIVLYDGEGATADGISEREFFTQHLQKVIALLTNPGPGGPMYPVDLRLRPRGKGGALVHSFREFRNYFTSDESQVWEHQALVRSAPVAGSPELAGEVMEFIRSHLGRGLDPAEIISEMKSMHDRRKAEGTGEGFYLKTGPGGLLDVEFVVQSAILLGQRDDPELWEPNTYAAIRLLQDRQLLPDRDAVVLGAAYQFFRLVENRLSMLHRASVRRVATDDASLHDLALRIGYDSAPGEAPEKLLLEEIRYHTRAVLEVFERRCGPAETRHH